MQPATTWYSKPYNGFGPHHVARMARWWAAKYRRYAPMTLYDRVRELMEQFPQSGSICCELSPYIEAPGRWTTTDDLASLAWQLRNLSLDR